eukprot:gene15035-biopygen706
MISSEHLRLLVEETGGLQWLVVAGWPCQDFSLAGPSRGLQADRSQLLFELVRLVGVLQQLQPDLPTAYLFENVPFQYHRKASISDEDFGTVTELIGQPVILDATQAGSFAHRLRNYWTNLCYAEQLEAAFWFIRRAEGRELRRILGPGRFPQEVVKEDRPPQHPCNQPGKPRRALPTLMSRVGSYAFRPGQPGSILDTSRGVTARVTAPTATERERAMGYLPGTTAAEGVSEEDRCKAIGQGMDANSLQLILATTEAYWTVSMHMSHCAPCHLPGIDSSIDPRLAEDIEEAVCEVCGTDEQEDKLLLCDLCTLGFHTFCLTPPMEAVPEGVWLCPICVQQGFTVEDAEQRAAKRQELLERESGPVIFPNAAMKKRDQEAAAKHGRLVKKVYF